MFKAEELQWSGLEEWMESLYGKVTKEQVLEFLRGNKLKGNDVLYGEQTQDCSVMAKVKRTYFDTAQEVKRIGNHQL